MPKFKDLKGREWPVLITTDAVKRVRSECEGLDLLAVADGKLFERLLADPVLLVDALWAVCKPAAAALTPPVTADDFGSAMGGDAIDTGTTALLEAVTDFFRSGQRATFKAALAKVLQAEGIATARAQKAVEAIDVEALLAQQSTPGGPSTASPA